MIEKIELRVTSPDCLSDTDCGEGGVHPQFFHQAMMNRMGVSYHKYGSFYDAFPKRKSGVDNALQRIEKYQADGNVEWLIDAANYLMMEGAAPGHPEAHFRATSSEESPGAVLRDGGIDLGKGMPNG